MTEEFTIQCQSCGTLYNDLQEICPYCGEPQPSLIEDEYLINPMLDDDQEDVLLDEAYSPSFTHASPQAVYPAEDEVYLPAEEHLLEDTYPPEADPFVGDDIFAVAGEDDALEHFDEYDEHEDFDEYDPEYNEYDEEYDEEYDQFDGYDQNNEAAILSEPYALDEQSEAISDAPPRRFTFRRLLGGCLVMLLCLGLLYGGIGFLAVRQGLQERALNNQTEAQQHYQRGQEYLANNSIELAIAEFERAISLNPNLLSARQALREAKRIALTQPTPTSETRSAAVAGFFDQAETQISEQNWAEAVQTLAQVRGLDPDFQPEQVSEMFYNANYQLGLQLVASEQLDEALTAFAEALAERPDDTQIAAEQTKASLYIDGLAAEQEDIERAVEIFDQLYKLDPNYLDAKQHLWRAHEFFGDELVKTNAWCQAEIQYLEANTIQPSNTLEIKANNAQNNCSGSVTPTSTATLGSSTTANTAPQSLPTATAEAIETPEITPTTSGNILFSAFNPNESRWEIMSVPATGGTPKVIVTDAIMPAVSPDGQYLLYHAELIDTEGLHLLNLTTGTDNRITKFRDHILPYWGGDNVQYLFTAQEAGTGRWQVHLGFADGKSEPIILRDGRTPAWSANGKTIAYQGTNAEGNNPGIYLVPFGGGEETILTAHESDRSPAFSPDGSQLVYMSTQNENWDIFAVSVAGGTPRQLTTAPGNDGLPVWSPNGSQIAYVSDADGSWAIYVINATGGPPTKVIEWDGSNRTDWLMGQIWWTR